MTEKSLSSTRRVLFSLLLLGLLALATLVLIEVLLQVGSLFARPRHAASSAGGDQVVLCLGDSNTYGVFYSQELSYPAQLQTVLDRRAPGRFKTLNLGLPGMNSSQVASRLEGWLDGFRPRFVVVSVGINNYWNTADTDQERPSWLGRSRVLRLARLLMAGEASVPSGTGRPEVDWVLPEGGDTYNQQVDAETREVLIEHRGDWRDWSRSDAEVLLEVRSDLSAMAELTRKRGVELILMTYAAVDLPGRVSRFTRQRRVNDVIRRLAAAEGIPLVDPAPRFSELLSRGRPRALLFASESDSHANPVGNREIAALVADEILGRDEGAAPEVEGAPLDEAVQLLLDRLDEAVIERQPVDYEQVARRSVQIRRSARRVLFQHPTTSVSFPPVEIAPASVLQFAIGMLPASWERAGDGVRFEIELLDEEGTSQRIYSRYIDPKRSENQRRWLNERVDLRAFAGRRAILVFKTSPGPDGNSYFDWAVWAEPRVVSAPGSATVAAP